MARKGQLVQVEWLDATGSGRWTDRDVAIKWEPDRCVTVGRILSIDRKVLRLYGTISKQDSIMDVNVIPRNNVTKITRLEKRKE